MGSQIRQSQWLTKELLEEVTMLFGYGVLEVRRVAGHIGLIGDGAFAENNAQAFHEFLALGAVVKFGKTDDVRQGVTSFAGGGVCDPRQGKQRVR